jgi:hypothetical protein
MGKTLCEYTLFQDIAEIRATIELLAYEKDISENEIIAEVIGDTEKEKGMSKE